MKYRIIPTTDDDPAGIDESTLSTADFYIVRAASEESYKGEFEKAEGLVSLHQAICEATLFPKKLKLYQIKIDIYSSPPNLYMLASSPMEVIERLNKRFGGEKEGKGHTSGELHLREVNFVYAEPRGQREHIAIMKRKVWVDKQAGDSMSHTLSCYIREIEADGFGTFALELGILNETDSNPRAESKE